MPEARAVEVRSLGWLWGVTQFPCSDAGGGPRWLGGRWWWRWWPLGWQAGGCRGFLFLQDPAGIVPHSEGGRASSCTCPEHLLGRKSPWQLRRFLHPCSIGDRGLCLCLSPCSRDVPTVGTGHWCPGRSASGQGQLCCRATWKPDPSLRGLLGLRPPVTGGEIWDPPNLSTSSALCSQPQGRQMVSHLP